MIRGLRRSLPGALAALVLLAAQASAAPGWSGPRTLGSSTLCGDLSATIDSAGTSYVAAECDTNIRVSYNTGLVWTTVQFGHPADRFDLAPQIAVDGTKLHVAFTRAAPATCGLDYIGVYIRSRNLPSGTWSQPIRIGNIGDRLQSFRIVNGVIHATVANGDAVVYETTATGRLKRYPLSDAVGGSSLRVGSDGVARIVYEGETALRYAVFLGSTFEKSSIPGTTGDDRDPQLVLDADNNAHVVFTHTGPPGCGLDDPEPEDGTYYLTNASGTWAPSPAATQRRVTRNVGQPSLTIDISTGRPHVLVGGPFGLKYYTPGSGKWNGLTLSAQLAWDTSIRLNPANGSLIAVYSRIYDVEDPVAPNLHYLTKP